MVRHIPPKKRSDPDTKTVMDCLNDWFTDYNENHPHKGLGMKSPREFIREVARAL
jgi:transposase InsO family protein